jgi:hypothetical protein
MKIEILLDHRAVLENRSPVFFGARLRADHVPTPERAPAAHCLLIDCSASMDGERLPRALRLAQEFVRHLPDGAKLAVIAFNEQAEFVFGPDLVEDKPAVEAMIGGISLSRNGANFSGAWLLARQMFLQIAPDRARRALVLSAGEFIHGLRAENVLTRLAQQGREEKIVLSAVACHERGMAGGGASLLDNLAVAGGGFFHDLSQRQDFSQIISRETGGLLPVAAQNVRLRLKRLDLCDSIEALGEHRNHVADVGDASLEFCVRDLLSGEEQPICFYLETARMPCIENQPVSTVEGEALLELELSYDSIRPEGIQRRACRQIVRASPQQEPCELQNAAPLISLQ